MSKPEDTPTPVLGEPPEPSLSENDPKTIAGRYTVLDHLGEGGMGRVYLAIDPTFDRKVAIKVLLSGTFTDTQLTRFQQEARAAGKVNHPGIVTVYDFGLTEEGNPYLVMDYVDGETFESYLQERGTLELEEFVEIFHQLVLALAHAHNQGIIHRDLKTSNIVIAETDGGLRALILDFGIAKMIHDGEALAQTGTGQMVGSPRCISPEQIKGGTVDARSDVYSLGCLMYQALTGEPPFQGESHMETLQMHLNEAAPRLSEFGEMPLPDQLDELVAKTLAKEPDDRYQSMSDLREALLSIGTLDTINEADAEKPSQEYKPGLSISRSLKVFALLIVLGVIVASASLFRPPIEKKVADEDSGPRVSEESNARRENNIERSVFSIDGKAEPPPQGPLSLDSPWLVRYFKVERQGPEVTLNANDPVTDESVTALTRLENCPIERLVLDSSHVTDESAFTIRNLSLSRLDLRDTSFGDKGLKILLGEEAMNSPTTVFARHIKYLNLANTDVTNRGMSTLARYPALEGVGIGRTAVDRHGLRQLDKSKTVRMLDLSGSDLDDKDWMELSRLPKLTYLRAPNTNLNSTGARAIKALTKLDTINVSNTPNVDDECLSLIASCPMLRTVTMSSCAVTDNGFESLSKLSRLEKLTADKTSFGRIGVLALSKCKRLKELDLRKTNIDDHCLRVIAGYKNLHSLKVSGHSLTDAGIEQLGNLKGLQQLTLSSTSIGARGVKAVSSLKKLEYLSLRNTQIDDQCLEMLTECRALRNLVVSRCTKLSDRAVEKFQMSRTDCQLQTGGF